VESGEWRVESGEWRVESGEWRGERGDRGERKTYKESGSGEWPVVGGGQRRVDGEKSSMDNEICNAKSKYSGCWRVCVE
jgi:hypothetical protein